MAGMKTTSLLLKPRFDYATDFPLKQPGIGLPCEAEECDLPVAGAHPLVPPPVCQSRGTVPDCHVILKRRVSPTTSRGFRYSGRISSTPKALPPLSFLPTLMTSAWVMSKSNSESIVSTSTREGMTVGLRRSSKDSFALPILYQHFVKCYTGLFSAPLE
ncbi:hypothetical protein GOODEAATRI_024440 [Goodea atripinnis]|uniref:Uncharacterized protein n=1 Tax=Goodea atripinnis TaxID=208336 RepID=A0ABV0N799_9TELE